MPQAVEIVALVYDAYARRDNATPFELYATDIEWDISELGHFGVARVYHGHDGVRECFRDLLSAFGEFEIGAEELRGSGQRVLVTVREHAVGRASGVVVDRRHHALWTVRDGKVAQMRVYLDRGDAERALGAPREQASLDGAPSANVEIVQRGIDGFNRRSVQTLGELTTPDFVWSPALPGTVEGDSYRGRRGIEAYFEEILGTWEELRVLVEEYRDLGDSVLALGRAEGRGRGSGAQVDTPMSILFDLRQGRISSARTYLDRSEALKAAGLSESG